jgi:hypothetical protein
MRRINYTDLDQMYRPGFVHVNGLGGNDRMMGGILASLFGKPQSWYDTISRIQKELTILITEVSAFGNEVWDAVSSAATAKGIQFTKYDYTQEWATNHMKAILVTKSYEPSDAVIASADTYAKRVRAMVEFAKKIAPEMAAQVAADRAKVEANLAGSRLVSPAVAGEAAFIKSLEEQAGKVAFGMGGLGIGIAAIAALWFLGPMLSGRRNNPVLPISWNPGGFFSGKMLGLPKPLAYVGGAYVAWKFLKPKSA